MFGSMACGRRPNNGRVVVGEIMSQLLRTLTMNNYINRMAKQLGEHGEDLNNMFPRIGGSQDGFDFSRALQQMIPFVSQILK
jgi:hypothetical protein